MSREVDRRNFSVNRVTSARETEMRSRELDISARSLEAGRGEVRITRFDPTTGNPAVVASESAPAERGNFVQRALEHVRSISGILGLEPTQGAEFVADPHYQQTSSGAVAVHLQQCYKGIAIFQAAQTVRFVPEASDRSLTRIRETAGTSITVARDLAVSPTLSAEEAVLKAAQHVAAPQADELGAKDQFGEPLKLPSVYTYVHVTGFVPKVSAVFSDSPEQPTVLEPGPFGDKIKASLIWFPGGEDLRLAWEVILTMPNYEGQYRTLVDAENGRILYCRQLVKTVLVRGNVYRADGGSPRQMTNFPMPLREYGLPIPANLPSGFPDPWVEGDSTQGNSVIARLGDSGSTIRRPIKDDVLTFDPVDPSGDDQKVLNIFYYNCFMHDFFYLLGFDETHGNFQQNNFGRGGAPTDPVDARAFTGPVFGTASMATPIDGSSPTMRMGLVTSTNFHTAFDSTVVFHEFMHGVTNRLVGGRMNDHALEMPQSAGQGEGWSDYIACIINETTVVGAWVVKRPGGIRGFPYDSNFPDNFGDLGKGRYVEEHNIGEIWCATLMEMTRKIGEKLGVQLVVDALKLSPANPSFLDMRDSILRALNDMLAAGPLSASEHAKVQRSIWEAFAKFGMGPRAQSNGASLSGVIADFIPPRAHVPPEPTGRRVQVEAAPNLSIPDNRRDGVASVLTVREAGQITRLTVAVDIEHTYIGDLLVSLVTPAGRTVILHNRTGAGVRNLVKTYTNEDTPALAVLAGEEAQGDWTLTIADLEAQDVGILRRWSLELGFEAAVVQVIRGEAAPALMIPDKDPAGLSSSIAITQSDTARGIKVSIDITHTYIGDLRIALVPPSGQQAILHNRMGGGQRNLVTTYDSLHTPVLAALVGQPIQGNWVLRVADLDAQDIGKLNKWSLELTL